MHWSHTYAAQESKSAFVEVSERSAATARLLHETRQAEPAQPPGQARSLARQAVSRWDHLLQRVGQRIAPNAGEACG